MTPTRSPNWEAGSEEIEVLRLLWPGRAVTLHRGPALRSSDISYALLPRVAAPTLLLPTAPPAVVASALAGYKSAAGSVARARSRALALAGRVGAGRVLPGIARIGGADDTSGDEVPESLVQHLGRHLGADVVAGIHLGPPRANRKPVLQVMNRDGATLAFTKVGVNELTKTRVRAEARALAALAQARPVGLHVPPVVAHGTWRDLEFAMLAPVDTWSWGGDQVATRARALRGLVDAFPTQRAPLARLPWWLELMNSLADLRGRDDGSPAASLAHAAHALDRSCGERPVVAGACHGDWTPWNLATTAEGAVVWDWERFAVDVPVGWDALHYAFQASVRLGSSGPRAALKDLAGQCSDVVTHNGAPAHDGAVLLALYALRLGERFVRDGQGKAGAKKGPLEQWLLPELDSLVDDAARSAS